MITGWVKFYVLSEHHLQQKNCNKHNVKCWNLVLQLYLLKLNRKKVNSQDDESQWMIDSSTKEKLQFMDTSILVATKKFIRLRKSSIINADNDSDEFSLRKIKSTVQDLHAVSRIQERNTTPYRVHKTISVTVNLWRAVNFVRMFKHFIHEYPTNPQWNACIICLFQVWHFLFQGFKGVLRNNETNVRQC